MFLPNKLLAIFRKIHRIKIPKNTFFHIIASMHQERVTEDGAYMIGSTADIFTLNFDFSPAIIKGVMEIGFDDEVRRLFLKHSRFVAIKLF